MEQEIIDEKTIKCECGKIITGVSEAHTKSNLENHKKSKEHKRNMRLLR
ncbi:MAG TPA: hypothetical protein VMZ91_14025 [Candidatus Paceibacterota bacterium]|nr:hypothetical protein [Candidatus Paceibacterota bacterium]